MIEIYNKYNILLTVFDKTSDVIVVLEKCKELKIKVYKIVRKTFQKLFTYYCTTCKIRSYFEDVQPEDCCQKCNSSLNLFFVGFRQTNKFIEEVFYAN